MLHNSGSNKVVTLTVKEALSKLDALTYNSTYNVEAFRTLTLTFR